MHPRFQYPNVPEQYRPFHCQQPGCREWAEVTLSMYHLPTVPNTRHFCRRCAKMHVEAGHGQVADMAPIGHSIYRQRIECFGGWRSWDYMIPTCNCLNHSRAEAKAVETGTTDKSLRLEEV